MRGLIRELQRITRPTQKSDENMVPGCFWGDCGELEEGKGFVSISGMPHIQLSHTVQNGVKKHWCNN